MTNDYPKSKIMNLIPCYLFYLFWY